MYNMLKMKKMNGLKIFALVLLSLSKFETMFGMKEKENENEDEINDEYVNKNYYLIDFLGNKITLDNDEDNDEDIKFKINNEEIGLAEFNMNEKILKIHENGKEKILVCKEKKVKYPVLYKNNAVNVWAKQNECGIIYFKPKEKNEDNTNTIECSIVKKIGEDSIKDDYILVDAENNKIEKIKGKNILFKLLTRKKCLELSEKLKDPQNYLKNDEEKYIIDDEQKPLFFEEEEENNNLILYVKRSKDNLWLANLLLFETNINLNKDNYIKVRMAKKKEIDKIEEKIEIDKIDKKEGEKVKKKEILKDEDSTKCCCGIC